MGGFNRNEKKPAKILFFTEGAAITDEEREAVESIVGNVQVRNGAIDARYGDNLEAADGLAGAIPDAYRTGPGGSIDTTAYPLGEVAPGTDTTDADRGDNGGDGPVKNNDDNEMGAPQRTTEAQTNTGAALKSDDLPKPGDADGLPAKLNTETTQQRMTADPSRPALNAADGAKSAEDFAPQNAKESPEAARKAQAERDAEKAKTTEAPKPAQANPRAPSSQSSPGKGK